MPVTIGTQLGSHELIGLLGKGGMGEVYRARDTKLKREVAIKILPDEFSRDPDRVNRFQREAEVLASLNHPNIAGIHSLEEANGSRFLVLELVEGETLAERIKRGPIPVDESLNIAKSICEALEAANEKGVVHRDLKPANVKITPDGKVKVLDFGLAKAFETEASKGNLSQSPTLSMAATNAGVILGTAAYMSPEQAKGQTVDRRTDIFALGAVLFEILTGHSAFGGDDVQDVLSAVLKSEPEWTRLPSDLPASIQRLLRLCLQKDMKKRRQTATDVRIDIEQALDKPEVAPASRTHERLWMGAAALFLIGIASLAILHFREPAPAQPFEMRTEIVTPATTDPTSFDLSPDGRQIVFVASGDGPSRLWVRSLTTSTTAKPLPGTEGAVFPFWSPDSRAVGFFTNRKLKRLKLGGGSLQELADVVGTRGATENADGVILFTPNTTSPLFRVPASGGLRVPVTKLDRQTSHRFPVFLPDGRQFLFYAVGTPETAGIYLASLDSAETTRLTGADTAGLYLSSGWLLWVQAGTLVGQYLDLERKVLSGDPVTLADRVAFNGNSAARGVSVSATGMVAYRAGGDDLRQLAWFNRKGNQLGTMDVPAESDLSYPALSPNGLRVAAQLFVKGITDIWLLGAQTGKFTSDPAGDYSPIWSHDGTRIVFASNRKGHRDIYLKPFGVDGGEELLLESSQDKIPTDWSRDGRFILYHAAESQTSQDLCVLSMEGEHHSWKLLETSSDERYGQFSPDGRWVAYMSNVTGRHEIYILPFVAPATPGTATNRVAMPLPITTTGGTFPRWRRSDGKELYYIDRNGMMMAVSITVTGTTLEAGAPGMLFATRMYGGGAEDQSAQQYDVDGNGRFLINTVLDNSSPITLIQNWTPPAK